MHMSDALISPAVGGGMALISVGAIALAAAKTKREDLCEKKVPVMAMAGAFVFAAQMVNITIPGTGSSGHIGGGILLAGLLGAYPSLLSVAAVLIIQALFFADGGLVALGCNIFNMGVLPCLVVYPLIFKPIVKKDFTKKRIVLASVVSGIAALQLGAFGVVLETAASGITALPFGRFLLLMQPIHLAIGILEGLITAAVLSFLHGVRPELMESAAKSQPVGANASYKRVVVVLAVLAILTGGLLSLAASAYPDGLEWSVEKVAGTAELESEAPLFESAAAAQEKTAVMPDYGLKNGTGSAAETSLAGIVGGAGVAALAGLAGAIISKTKKAKKAV